MAARNENRVAVCMALPKVWVKALQQEAETKTLETGKLYSYLDLVREAVAEKLHVVNTIRGRISSPAK